LLSGLFFGGLQTSSKRFVAGPALADLSWYREIGLLAAYYARVVETRV
jgi:hypothetical protein